MLLLQMYIFFPDAAGSEELSQSPESLVVTAGATASLKCSATVAVRMLQWYRQNPDRTVHHLASGTSDQGRITAQYILSEKRSVLNVSETRLTDTV